MAMDCFMPDSMVPNPLLSSAAYRPSGLNAIVSGKPLVRCGAPGVGLITALLVGSRVRSCSWFAASPTERMEHRSRNTILIPADKRPPANRDGWKRHAAIVRLTIESRNTLEHKLQNCKNQNALGHRELQTTRLSR